MKERVRDIIGFINGTADEHMSAFAAQSAFFIFLSFFPLINIIMIIPKYLPFTKDQLLEALYYIIPVNFRDFITGFIDEMYATPTDSLTIISLVITIWSAAKGIMAVRNGLNEVYRSRESRNYFIIRSISSVYTVCFIILLVALVPLNIFGTQIAKYLIKQVPNITNVALLVYSLREAATFILLFLVFELMYTIVPSKKLKFRKQIPGAILASALWVIITKLFSLYIDYYASHAVMYGSLTTIVLLLFWMYMVINSIFIGAQLNEYLHTCRARDEKYERKKYGANVSEVWDDDEIALKEFIEKTLDEDPESIGVVEVDDEK